MKDYINTNRWSFGLGCIGRDMAYTLVNSFIIIYLTFGVGITDFQLFAVGSIMLFARVWDAINDPIMGTIVDNTRTRFGKFKPWIISGALLNSFFIVLLFTDFELSGNAFLIVFGLSYTLWGMTYTINDISYWSMLPALTTDQKKREQIGTLARIGANIGLFVVTAGVPFITQLGKLTEMYRLTAIGIAAIFIACQCLVIFGVVEVKDEVTSQQNSTSLKEMLIIIRKNDQLLAIVVSILLFNIGYFTTTGFGIPFFNFDYGVYGGMEFTIFAIVLGVTQIATLALFPIISKGRTRKQLFTLSIALVLIGYLGFLSVGYILPMSMAMLCGAGFFMFSGQAIIQLLMLMMLADTIEYGQWKLGTRNESIILALNPFVTKLASAFQAGILSLTLIVSGLNPISGKIALLEKDKALQKEEVTRLANELVKTVTPEMKLILRSSMIILPLFLIIASYFVYIRFYKIDGAMYSKMLDEIKQRVNTKETKND